MAASGSRSLLNAKKKAGARPAFSQIELARRSSVLRDDRATPAVVDAHGGDVDVLADAVDRGEQAGSVPEAEGLILHEHVVVFDRCRPVRSEAVFDAAADDGAPAGFTGRVENRVGGDDAMLVT